MAGYVPEGNDIPANMGTADASSGGTDEASLRSTNNDNNNNDNQSATQSFRYGYNSYTIGKLVDDMWPSAKKKQGAPPDSPVIPPAAKRIATASKVDFQRQEQAKAFNELYRDSNAPKTMETFPFDQRAETLQEHAKNCYDRNKDYFGTGNPSISQVKDMLDVDYVDPTHEQEIAIGAVYQYGPNLEHFSSELRNDKVVVIVACSQDGNSLQYASGELQNDKEVVMKACSQDGYALNYASKQLQNDKA